MPPVLPGLRPAHLPRRRRPPRVTPAASPAEPATRKGGRDVRPAGRLGLDPRQAASLARSLARWLAWRRAPTVLSARGGGQRSVPSGRRRDAPAQRGAAPCCCTDKRAALPPSRRGSGIWRSELRFTRVLCGKADAGPGAAEGARWSTAPKSLTPHREAPCWGREKAEARRRRRGGRGRRRRADKSEVNRKAP